MTRVIFFIFFICSIAFGSGKVSIAPTYYLKTDKVYPTLGLSIYEHVVAGIHYNAWTGMGWQPRFHDDTVMWIVSKHDFEKWFMDGNLGVAVGYTFAHADKPDNSLLISDHNVHLKLTYKIW